MRVLLSALLLTACNPTAPKDYEEPPDTVVDDDGDGFTKEEGDCNDQDAGIYPGLPEVCDSLDNNCDGVVDEGVATTYYADGDSDGYGDPGATAADCAPPSGYVSIATDCDDQNSSIWPGAPELCDDLDNDCDGLVDDGTGFTMYADLDGDGYGDPDNAVVVCTPLAGYVLDDRDCDDMQPGSYPGASEYCDGLDNDCDGLTDEEAVDTTTWYYDADGDGYGNCAAGVDACTAPNGYVSATFASQCDCNDGRAESNPGGTEVCNGFDDDCDGSVDEDGSTGTWYADADSDGYGDASAPLSGCSQPAGSSANADDCDDADAAINPGETEACNGSADDCDGQIDEPGSTGGGTWYTDADGDSFGDPNAPQSDCTQPAGTVADNTDCNDADATIYPGAPETWYDGIDSNCDGDDDPSTCDSLPGDATVAYDATCSANYSNSGWSVVTEWTTDSGGLTYSSGTTATHIMAAPVAGPLYDDNGDGLINEEDPVFILYNTFSSSNYSSSGYLRAVAGDGSGELWTMRSVSYNGNSYNPYSTAGVAIGDLDGDGSPDVVTIGSAYNVIALEADGTVKWVSSTTVGSGTISPSIADMNADGTPEVIAGKYIFTSTGSLYSTSADCGSSSMPADIGNNGDLELVCGGAVYQDDGTLYWKDSSHLAARMVPVQLDSDSKAEFVNVYGGNFYAYDDNGTALWNYTGPDLGGGSPVVADIDGDGYAEIASSFETVMIVLEHTGTQKFRKTIDDTSSRSTGMSAFDFNADGAAELVYADEEYLYVWDGSGTELYKTSSHTSGTLQEFPLVADVDRDGNAEIVLVSNDYISTGWDGLRVLGEANDKWASSLLYWNQYQYNPSTIEADMSIPVSPTLPWLDTGGWRQQASWSTDPTGAPDVTPILVGVCTACSAGTAEVYVSIENLGSVFVGPELPIALYADNGGSRTLIDVQTLGRVAYPGDQLAPITFSIATSDIGSSGLVVVADDDGTGADTQQECDESNNEDSWNETVCP